MLMPTIQPAEIWKESAEDVGGFIHDDELGDFVALGGQVGARS